MLVKNENYNVIGIKEGRESLQLEFQSFYIEGKV